MIPPSALHRRIDAIRALTDWNGAPLRPGAPLMHRVALRAESAGGMLAAARARLASAYHPTRGASVATLAWWQRAARRELALARGDIRGAARVLEGCEAEAAAIHQPLAAE